MLIRRAVEGDAEELSELVQRAKAHWGYSRAQLQAWRSSLEVSAETVSDQPKFVAEIDGQMIGFYSFVPAQEVWELDSLWVLPQFMRKGVGRTLLEHASQTAAEGGAISIVVDADPNAEPFYLRCGAARIGAVAAPIAGQPDRVRPRLALAVMRSVGADSQ